MNSACKKILYGKNKGYFKGNMHCHTNLSDGNLSPEEIKELYKGKGYSFVAFTDHDHINKHSYLDDKDFIAITSCEVTIKERSNISTSKDPNMKVCHLNFYAKDQDNVLNVCYSPLLDKFTTGEKRASLPKLNGDYVRVYTAECINEMIRLANENGFFVSYNHPRWSLENYREYSRYEGIWGVEIYNTSCNDGGIYEYDINVLDDFLRDNKRVFATCGDDNHNSKTRRYELAAFVCVNAEELTYENIINGLLKGDFYSSNGPEISKIYVEENKVYIECSDAAMITYSTFGRRSASVIAEEGKAVNGACFEIKDTDMFFRLDVIDEKGRRANTQPYYLEDL